jgi:hypothetical protein
MYLHLPRNRLQKLAKDWLFYLFLKLVQMNYIFSDNAHMGWLIKFTVILPIHVNTQNIFWLPWIISILICLTVQIRWYALIGRRQFIFTFAENVTHNLCCQIRTDDNSSTWTFTTGKSVVLMEHPQQQYCVCMF